MFLRDAISDLHLNCTVGRLSPVYRVFSPQPVAVQRRRCRRYQTASRRPAPDAEPHRGDRAARVYYEVSAQHCVFRKN